MGDLFKDGAVFGIVDGEGDVLLFPVDVDGAEVGFPVVGSWDAVSVAVVRRSGVGEAAGGHFEEVVWEPAFFF